MSKPTKEVVINCVDGALSSVYADGDGVTVRVNHFDTPATGVTQEFMEGALDRSGFKRQTVIHSSDRPTANEQQTENAK